jgi:CRP-like cAMP-binding protein
MEQNQTGQTLHDHFLLQRLSEDQLSRISQVGARQTYQPGDKIVTEGSVGDSIYLILSGWTEVRKESAGGRRLASLGAGDFFGEMSFVEPATRSASVVAMEPTEVLRLPNQALLELADQDPRTMNLVLIAVVQRLSERLRRMNETVAMVGQLSEWLAGSLL